MRARVDYSRRTLSIGVAFLAVLCLGTGVGVTPPMLERILVDGEVGHWALQLAAWSGALVLLISAVLLLTASRRLWTRTSDTSSRVWVLRCAAAALGISVALIAAELGSRVAFDLDQISLDEQYWIRRWQASREARGSNTLKSEYPVDRFDHELGWVPREGYRSPTLNINSEGARGLQEYTPRKPEGTRRIVVLGDSFTFGEGVADEDAYPAILARRLEAEVVNLGVLGYGTDQQYLRMKRQAFLYAPDLVLLGFFAPDIDRNVLFFRDYAKPLFQLADGNLVLTNVPVPDPSYPDVHWIARPPASYLLAAAGTLTQRFVDRTRLARKWAVTAAILDAMLAEAQHRNTRFVLAFFPDKWQSFSSTPSDAEIILREWAARREVPFLNLRPRFASLPPADQGRVYHGHWTPFGNDVVAAFIAQELQARRLL